MNGRAGILSVMMALGGLAVLAVAWLLFWLVLCAVAVVAGAGKMAYEIYRSFHDRKPMDIKHAPRPLMTTVGPGNGPRDWRPKESQ